MIEFIEYDKKFLKLSWEWLNNLDIKMLTNTPDFSKEQQNEWFLSLGSKKDYYLRGILFDGRRIGVVGLKNITSTKGEYWGYIGDKEYWGKGVGKRMINYIIEVAKETNLKIIYLKVLKSNDRAISLYSKMGFEIIKEKGNSNELYMRLNINC